MNEFSFQLKINIYALSYFCYIKTHIHFASFFILIFKRYSNLLCRHNKFKYYLRSIKYIFEYYFCSIRNGWNFFDNILKRLQIFFLWHFINLSRFHVQESRTFYYFRAVSEILQTDFAIFIKCFTFQLKYFWNISENFRCCMGEQRVNLSC